MSRFGDRVRFALSSRLQAAFTRLPLAAGYCVLFLLFWLLYQQTATRCYTFDAVSYALQIARFEQSGAWRWLFHPHHLLFNGIGLLAHQGLLFARCALGPLDALQAMNALLGAGGVTLFAWIVGRLTADRGAGLLAAAGLGLSYGYWVCGADGRVNMPGVVVLCAQLGLLAALLRPGGRAVPLAAALGGLHFLAVMLHQSHLLFFIPALTALALMPLPGARERARCALAYLSALILPAAAAYLLAAYLAAGTLGPTGVLNWALTYAREGHWWSLDVTTNLGRDVYAFTRAVLAGPETGVGNGSGLPLRVACWLLLALALVLTISHLNHATVSVGEQAERVAAQRRLALALVVWMAAYAFFFTFWNPGYFVFWVPLLVPFWTLIGIGLAPRRAPLAARPGRWLPAALGLSLLAVNNLRAGIAPHTFAASNPFLQSALAAREHVRKGDTILIAGAGDHADAEVYLPYFAGCSVLSLLAVQGAAPQPEKAFPELFGQLKTALRSGRVFVHEELLSSDGPYAPLNPRACLTRKKMVRFLHRHYQVGRPVCWRRSVPAKR